MAKPKSEKQMTKTISAPKKDSTKATKTITKKTRVAKQRKPVSEMVIAVMKQYRDGCTLQMIRNSILKEFGVKMSKTMQGTIKEYLTEEFEQGRLKMVDHDGDEIKFNQRLQLVEKFKN